MDTSKNFRLLRKFQDVYNEGTYAETSEWIKNREDWQERSYFSAVLNYIEERGLGKTYLASEVFERVVRDVTIPEDLENPGSCFSGFLLRFLRRN